MGSLDRTATKPLSHISGVGRLNLLLPFRSAKGHVLCNAKKIHIFYRFKPCSSRTTSGRSSFMGTYVDLLCAEDSSFYICIQLGVPWVGMWIYYM